MQDTFSVLCCRWWLMSDHHQCLPRLSRVSVVVVAIFDLGVKSREEIEKVAHPRTYPNFRTRNLKTYSLCVVWAARWRWSESDDDDGTATIPHFSAWFSCWSFKKPAQARDVLGLDFIVIPIAFRFYGHKEHQWIVVSTRMACLELSKELDSRVTER